MCPLEGSNSTRMSPEKYNIAETQDKDVKIDYMY